MKNNFAVISFRILIILFALILSGISCRPKNNPKDLHINIEAYEKLVALIMKECKPGQMIENEQLSRGILVLLDSLSISSIAYGASDTNSTISEGKYIRLCGEGNIFSGDSCYTYNYGQGELEIRNNQYSGFERTKISSKWYKEFIYFD